MSASIRQRSAWRRRNSAGRAVVSATALRRKDRCYFAVTVLGSNAHGVLASHLLPNGRRTHPNCLKQGLGDRAISLAENWTGETEVQTKFLHLFGDFSQPAISRHKSGNSADISKRYFQNCTASSSPSWSASKSLILQRELERRQFARHSRRLASAFARIPN